MSYSIQSCCTKLQKKGTLSRRAPPTARLVRRILDEPMYSWRPEVFPLPIWDKLEIKLQNPKIEIECQQATAIFCPTTQYFSSSYKQILLSPWISGGGFSLRPLVRNRKRKNFWAPRGQLSRCTTQ